MQCLKFEFVCVAVAPGGLDGCFGFTVKVVAPETASKGTQGEKRLGKEDAKVSVRIPKERIKQGRPLQECNVWFLCRKVSYLIRWSVVFTLSASATAFPASASRQFSLRLQSKGKGGGRGCEVRSKSQRAHSKERVKQGRPLVDWYAANIRKTTKVVSLLEIFQRAVGFQGLCHHLATVWPKLANMETAKQKGSQERMEVKTIEVSRHKHKHKYES